MSQYIGQITVIVETATPAEASETLRFLAKQIDDTARQVVFADHNGDVEDYEAVERECEESLRPQPVFLARFDDYEIHGISQLDDDGCKFCEQVDDDEAQFWSLYGHITGQGVECIGDFKTREHAEEVYARITGRRYGRSS